ncbi:MAG: hypothetical protein IPI43_27290 [Sandaracinaceae bacterium]|nr:hypothetical protein [Sandaracinaceae bacterium]
MPEDAGSSDADSTPQEVELRFTDTSALQLTPRANVTVELQVMRAGEPAPGITVRLRAPKVTPTTPRSWRSAG